MINACDLEIQKQHEATAHVKLQDLGLVSKRSSTDPFSLVPITSTILGQELAPTTSDNSEQHGSRELPGAMQTHKSSMQADRLAMQPATIRDSSLASSVVQGAAHECWIEDSAVGGSTIDNTNKLTLMACSSLHTMEDGLNKQDTQATHSSDFKEQDGKLVMHIHHKRDMQQEEQSIKLNSFCPKLEITEATMAGDGAPSRFLQVAGVGNQLCDQDRVQIKRKRVELALSPSKEKLKILENIYNAIYQWENTLWAYECEQLWDPCLVFLTIEAARGGDEAVTELLKSKDSGSRLLICCEAICELMHAFPPENLLPAEFVKDCLLAASGVRPDVHAWVQSNQLTTYQDVDSSMFWGSLTRHAMYLVTHELATAKQIASIFTGILLPASRLRNSSKADYENARLNLHIFIAVVLGAKDAAPASFVAKGCISNGQDCDREVALYKDGGHDVQEKDGCLLSALEELPTCSPDQTVEELSISTAAAPASASSCLSCSMLVKCLPWRRAKAKDG